MKMQHQEIIILALTASSMAEGERFVRTAEAFANLAFSASQVEWLEACDKSATEGGEGAKRFCLLGIFTDH